MAIHCTNNQLELAMKDALEADSAFKDFDRILLEMYLLTRDNVFVNIDPNATQGDVCNIC